MVQYKVTKTQICSKVYVIRVKLNTLACSPQLLKQAACFNKGHKAKCVEVNNHNTRANRRTEEEISYHLVGESIEKFNKTGLVTA